MPQDNAIKRSELTGRRRLLVAALIFLVVACAIAFTTRDPGLTWDEPIYHESANIYADWLEGRFADPFDAETIRAVWGGKFDHPPLAKLWISACHFIFGTVGDPFIAARIGAGVLFGLAAAALYLWLASRGRERVGFLAAITFVLMPRVFAHGHFANIEMPMLLLWLLTTIAFEKGIGSMRWSVLCGVFFGLALLTKINAVFLPLVLLPWGLIFHGRKALHNLIFMAVLGPLIFFIGWPVMWYHPVLATRAYLADKIGRPVIATYYLGGTYGQSYPAWHYPFVMLAATTPLPVLAAAVAGAWQSVRRLVHGWKEASFEALIVWSFAFHVLLLAMPGTPKYDGIRLMVLAYPFLAVLAPLGAVSAWDWLRPRLQKPRKAAAVLGTAAGLWLIVPIVILHPFQLCYYGELVGGPWGAEKLGFETTYWHDTFNRDAIAYLNAHVPDKGRVALVPIEYRVWMTYQEQGQIRKGIKHTNYADRNWDYLVVVPRQGKLSKDLLEFMRTHKPEWVKPLTPFGKLPVCLIYKKK